MSRALINKDFCESLTYYKRIKTNEVFIGDIPMGGLNPIRIQSMTNTNTLDTKATVEQAIRIFDAGADYVRITTPTIKDAHNLELIRKELNKQGYKKPLIADIHFNPAVAETAARLVEKIRINPGNYIDKKKFEHLIYTDAEYNLEVEKIADRFIPLIKICKKNGTAIRVGTNHGSLSDRIMSKYGDTPLGMVESTMEFLRICKNENFDQVVISLKSSNTRVMVQAYRLLVIKMNGEEMFYPLHLGVTEAGDGEDGRIKSAAGIGALLNDGVGDTIRVSLTESPEVEIPVAKNLVKYYANRTSFYNEDKRTPRVGFIPFEYNRRLQGDTFNFGPNKPTAVFADAGIKPLTPEMLINYGFSKQDDGKFLPSTTSPDFIFIRNIENWKNVHDFAENLNLIVDVDTWRLLAHKKPVTPLFTYQQFVKAEILSPVFNLVKIGWREITVSLLSKFDKHFPTGLVLDDIYQLPKESVFYEQRMSVLEIIKSKTDIPIIISRRYDETDVATFQLKAAADCGSFFIDGFADGIWLSNRNDEISPDIINNTSFTILQASRVRQSKTEYISCPSCGRTNFDLENVTAKVKKATKQLTGLKIAVMGCIVNGLGEMADADYGYVGTVPGKVTLYKGKTVIAKNIDEKDAVDELINLISENGDWKE